MKWLSFRALLLALLGSCGTAPDAPAPASAAGRPKLPRLGQWALAGYHRYRGWLGTELITMELTFSSGEFGLGPECNGRYYYERYGGAIDVLGQRLMAAEDSARSLVFRSEQPLFLSTWDLGSEQWQAVQVAGPLLHGLWTSRFGLVRQYFELREDYEGAVRYETADAQAYTVCTPYDEATGKSYSDTSTITRSYLHLLGPDTLLPALGRLQCPGPARRRAEVHALARD